MKSEQLRFLTQTRGNNMTKKRRNQLNAECTSSRVLREVFAKQTKDLQIKILRLTADGLITADEGMQEFNKFEKLGNDIVFQFRCDLDLEEAIN